MQDQNSQATGLDVGKLGAVFLAVGLMFIGASLFVPWLMARNEASQSARATGTVVNFVWYRIGKGSDKHPLIGFTPRGGKPVTFEYDWPILPGLPSQIGEQVTVAYDPANPEDATVVGTWETLWPALFPAILGLLFAGFGFYAMKFAGARIRRPTLAPRIRRLGNGAQDQSRLPTNRPPDSA